MNVHKAAEQLYEHLKGRGCALSTAARETGTSKEIVVWVDPAQLASLCFPVPSVYEGFPVTLEKKPQAYGSLSLH